MKILNLYCGIGGNRKEWGEEHDITAVEIDPKIAQIYQDFFPKDKVVVGDAHKYLEEHFSEFDFIWSSPPCPTHSSVRKANGVQNKAIFPNMMLYEEILFLQGYFKGKYVVENVISWYEPLVKPFEISKHYFWTNFYIHPIPSEGRNMGKGETLAAHYIQKGFDLSKYNGIDKLKTMRNCVEPKTGLWVFQEAFKEYRTLL